MPLPSLDSGSGISHLKSVPPVQPLDNKMKNEATETVKRTGLEKLPPQTEPTQSKVGGLWAWLGWGKATDISTQKIETTRKQEEETSSSKEEIAEEGVESKPLESEPELDDFIRNEPQVKNPPPSKPTQIPEELESTVVKTHQVSEQTYWEKFKGGIGKATSMVATPILKKYAQSYGNFDKTRVIAESKQKMLDQLGDPQFVAFFEWTSTSILPMIEGKLKASLAVNTDSISKIAKDELPLILKLIEVILARGFANLASQVRENKNSIANYDQQSSLVNVISLLCQKVGAHIDLKRLASLEKKYQKEQTDLRNYLEKLLPGIESQPETKQALQEYIKSTDIKRKKVIAQKMFPDLGNLSGQRSEDVQALLATLDVLHEKDQELNQLFSQVSDDVLLYLFPNKLKDIKEFEGWLSYFMGDVAYNVIKGIVTDNLQELYVSVENSAVRNEAWKKDVQAHLGAPDLQPVVEAPAALLVAYTKNYIQADSSAVDLTAKALDQMANPQATEKDKAMNLQEKKQKQILNQLSQQQLANWIVESIQSMLHTQDPNLSGLGEFAKQAFNNLTLAIMAKGSKWIIPEGEKIEPNEFMKEFFDRIVEKFRSFQSGEAIPDQFWKDFLNDLPLPSQAKDLLAPLLIGQAKSLQQELTSVDFSEIQKVQVEAENKILSYKRGKELLSITKTVSDQIIEQGLGKNIELITTLGLGDTIDELFAQYLPGVTINDALKKWFKENISALGTTEREKSPQSIILLKQGIQVVLQKAIINTIEKNFKDNSTDYAAQLLEKFHQAFSKAFTGFTRDEQRKEFQEALKIQVQIENKNNRIKAIKKEIAKKPAGITARQASLLEEIINANIRYIRARNYTDSLIKKTEEILAELNKSYKENAWTIEFLPIVNEALILRKIDGPAYSDVSAHKVALEAEIKRYEELEGREGKLNADQEQGLAQRQALLAILEMSTNELKLLSEAVNTRVTMQHADKEAGYLRKELEAKQDAVAKQSQEKITNATEWKEAQDWMKQVLVSKQAINQLSQEITDLEKELDSQLKVFQILSEELTGLLGLGEKEKLDLHPFLQDNVWPLIESAQKHHIARLLFARLSPLLICITDIKQNQDKLNELSGGNPFLGQIVHAISKEIVNRVPEFVASYKPFATQILTIMGVSDPVEEEVVRMERAIGENLIELGKKGTTAAMIKPLVKKIVPKDQEKTFSQSLETLIAQPGKTGCLPEDVLDLLKKLIVPTGKKGENKLEKQAQELAKGINQFLLNRGKTNLEPKNLLEAYHDQLDGGQKPIPADKTEGILENLKSARLAEKIQTVVVTPEEMMETLNEVIPGASDLHSLIVPQLQAAIAGKDPAFQVSREILQQFLEGTILRLFVKIAEKNTVQDQNILTTIAKKLKDLAENPALAKVQTAEEAETAARGMVDKVLKDVLGLVSKEDLDSIPSAFRKITYEKIQEQADQQLTPLILPITERNQNREDLEGKSGSKFLGKLCEALSIDTFTLLPLGVVSYKAIAQKILILLSGSPTPPSEQVELLTKEIAALVKEKNVKNHLLVEAYAKVTKQNLSSQEQGDLKTKLKDSKVKDEINNAFITSQEIIEDISEILHLDGHLQGTLADELQELIHGSPDAYQNIAGFVRTYVESVLLKIFIGVVERNPKEKGKDTLIVVTEKLLKATKEKYQEIRNGKKIEVAIKELNDSIMKDILGINSPDAFKGLPESSRKKVYDTIKSKLGEQLLKIQEGLDSVNDGNDQVKQAKEKVKDFGIAENATKSYIEILTEQLANMAMVSIPHILTEIIGEEKMGVTMISKSVESYLEDLSRGNIEVAKVLLNYTRGNEFKQILGENLTALAEAAYDKQKAVVFLRNLLIVPLNRVIDEAIQFEKVRKKEFNQKLMVNLLRVGAGHLQNLNKAKALAAQEGRKEVSHQDFVKAAGTELHPAVPTVPVTYQKTMDVIFNRIYDKKLTSEQKKIWIQKQPELHQLIANMVMDESNKKKTIKLDYFIKQFQSIHETVTRKPLSSRQEEALRNPDENGLTLQDLIRQEAEAPDIERQKVAYAPAIKTVLRMMFPNGKNDLTFIKEEALRKQAWKSLKRDLFPQLLPMLTELILDPAMINTMVLNSLETMRDSLKEEIVLPKKPPADLGEVELDEVAGELILAALGATQLPGWLKNLVLLDAEGKVTPEMKKSLGATLRKQFNDTFIQDNLKMAVEKAVQKNILNFDARSREEKEAETIEKASQMQTDLKKVSREVVDVSISYVIRLKWVTAQARFDELVEKAFGKIGKSLKQAFDAIFKFIFLEIVGSILSVVLWPLKQLVKQIIYSVISLDHNRDAILGMLTRVPTDQPETSSKYAVYNEDLIFKMGEVINKTVQDFIKNQPVLPLEKDFVA